MTNPPRRSALPVLVGLLAAGWSGAVLAQSPERFLPAKPGEAMCYERIYDAAHLARQPAQRVTRMALSLRHERVDWIADDAVVLRLGIRRRGETAMRHAIATCDLRADANTTVDGRPIIASHPAGAAIGCMVKTGRGLDEEGEYFLIVPRDGGRSLMVHLDESISVSADGTMVGKATDLPLGRADRVFRLDRADGDACAWDKGVAFE